MNPRNTHPHTPAPEITPAQFVTCNELPPLFVGDPPVAPPRDTRPDELHALARVECAGWTRNRETHETLRGLADAGLVIPRGTVIRRGPKDARGHYTRVFAGSQWELTEPGIVRLRTLREAGVEPPADPAAEIPTWAPAEIAASTREEAGIYRVELANGARGVVCRAGTRAAQWSHGWGWADKHGAVTGLLTKSDAMRSFREYRG